MWRFQPWEPSGFEFIQSRILLPVGADRTYLISSCYDEIMKGARRTSGYSLDEDACLRREYQKGGCSLWVPYYTTFMRPSSNSGTPDRTYLILSVVKSTSTWAIARLLVGMVFRRKLFYDSPLYDLSPVTGSTSLSFCQILQHQSISPSGLPIEEYVSLGIAEKPLRRSSSYICCKELEVAEGCNIILR